MPELKCPHCQNENLGLLTIISTEEYVIDATNGTLVVPVSVDDPIEVKECLACRRCAKQTPLADLGFTGLQAPARDGHMIAKYALRDSAMLVYRNDDDNYAVELYEDGDCQAQLIFVSLPAAIRHAETAIRRAILLYEINRRGIHPAKDSALNEDNRQRVIDLIDAFNVDYDAVEDLV